MSEEIDALELDELAEVEEASPARPVPTDEAIAAYHHAYQQAQLACLNYGHYDPEMTDKSLARANMTLREAWQVWRQTAQPLSIIDANNMLRRSGRTDLAEARYGQGAASMTIVGFEAGANGSTLPVYGVRQSGQADGYDCDAIRHAWRATVRQAWEHCLERLRIMGGPAQALREAMEATLP